MHSQPSKPVPLAHLHLAAVASSMATAEEVVPVHRCRIDKKPIVYFQINFLNVPTIDTVAQTWTCEFTLRGWTSGLKGARCWIHDETPPGDMRSPLWAKGTHARRLQLGDWEPRLRIANLVETTGWRQRCKWMTSAEEEMEFKWTISGTFLEQLEIGAFPRDIQALQIKITSTTPQFVLDRDVKGAELDGQPVGSHELVGLLDELAILERRAVEVDLNRQSPLSGVETARRAALLDWRSHDDRVRRKIRLAPHYEVTAEDDTLWSETLIGSNQPPLHPTTSPSPSSSDGPLSAPH